MRATSGNLNRVPLAPKPRWAVLISGRGSNLSSLLLNTDFDIRLVVSSSDSAEGLLKARRAGVPTRIAPTKRTLTGKTKLDFEKLSEELAQCGITHVLLAGFMKIVPASFVSRWNGKILNLHPSMLPLYPGLDSIQNAFAAGADMGVTVHEVNEEVDAGRIVAQRVCVNKLAAKTMSGEFAEFLVHLGEQRLLRQVVPRWVGLQGEAV